MLFLDRIDSNAKLFFMRNNSNAIVTLVIQLERTVTIAEHKK